MVREAYRLFRSPFRLLSLVALALLAGLAGRPAGAGADRFTPFGPGGGPVSCVVADAALPGTFYAATPLGLFKSADGALSWRWSGIGLPDEPVLDTAVEPGRPDVLYAAVEKALFRSEDAGGHWTRVLSFDAFTSLAVVPGGLFVAGGPLYRSTDRGESWTVVLSPAEGIGIVRVDPGEGAVYAVENSVAGTIFKSMDGGATWSQLPFPGHHDNWISALGFTPFHPLTLYAAAGTESKARVLASDDGGQTWTLRGSLGREPRVLVIDPLDSTTVYATATADGLGGVSVSRDGGRTWDRIDQGLPAREAVRTLAFDLSDPGMLYAGTAADGVFRLDTREEGARWQAGPQTGLSGLAVARMGFNPANPSMIFVTRDEGRPPLASRDGGRTWGPLSPALERRSVFGLAFDPTEPPALYALVNGSLWRSFTGGAAWARLGAVPEGFAEGPLASAGKRRLLLGGGVLGSGIVRSTDGGRTWSSVLAGRNPANGYDRVVLDLTSAPGEPEALYATVSESSGTAFERRLYRSLNAGTTWRRIAIGLEALAIDPTRPATLYMVRDLALWKSLDRGARWQEVGRLAEEGSGLRVADLLVDPAMPKVLYAATDQGVLRSTDGGAHWSAVNAGLWLQHRLDVKALVAHPADAHRIFALPSRGGIFEARFTGAK